VVKALWYKPGGNVFEELNDFFFSVYLILPATLGPGIYSVSNRNYYQKHTNNLSGEWSTPWN
jgi:hypothetical protein